MPRLRSLTLIAALFAGLAAPASAQQTLTAPGPEGELAGTLVTPKPDYPLVLIIPGSGMTDRDGNNPLAVTAAPYRLLAEALQQRGIGTLRIDKRGMFGSKAATADPNAVTIADYVADTASWIESARAQIAIDCVWLLGHSEGAIVALAAAQELDNLCGVILVTAPGRPMGTVLREQLHANPANAPLLEGVHAAIAQLEAGRRVDVDSLHPLLGGLFAPTVQGFMIDLMAHDPAQLAAATDEPLLIVHGGNDLQIGDADAAALRAGAPDAEYVEIDAMNHVFKEVPADDPFANRASYADASLPVAPALVEAVAEFVMRPRGEKE
ncbi:alpha/beta hydrolase [Qipengyuania flava]|nr:alpha/beta hydrolase [Qipengyuania flava]